MLIVWLVAIALFVVVEGLSVALCAIWFAVGSLAALIVTAFGGPPWLQILVFVLVSGACFALLYPMLKRFLHRHHQPTNADMLIGQNCIVTQRIDNIAGTGTVSIGGKTWTARSANDQVIEKDAIVRIHEIKGVKVFVSPAV